jgi:hypothetical protein
MGAGEKAFYILFWILADKIGMDDIILADKCWK